MDKNKNRTDLLAAGRKKLQQFRKQKDTKGSKSSGKSGKHDHADADRPTVEEVKSVNESDDKAVVLPVTVDTKDDDNSLMPAVAINDDSIIVADLPSENTGVVDSSLNTNISKQGTDIVAQDDTVCFFDAEDVVPEETKVTFGTVLHDDITVSRELEVTDGADQEVDHPVSEKTNEGVSLKLKGDASSDNPIPDGMTEPESVATIEEKVMKEQHFQLDPIDELNAVLPPSGTTNEVEQTQIINVGSLPVLVLSESCGFLPAENEELLVTQGDAEAGLADEDMLQKHLDEQFHVNMNMIEHNNGGLRSHLDITEHISSDLLHRLTEHLYLAYFSRDVCLLKLNEQSEWQKEHDHKHIQLVNENYVSSALVNNVQGQNKSLSEELEQCKSELQSISYARKELDDQFLASRTQVDDLSMKVNELNLKLDNSRDELSNKSAELASSAALLEALQIENANLRENMTFATVENKKLLDDNLNYGDEREKLLEDLTKHNGYLTSLLVENINLNVNSASIVEELRCLEDLKVDIMHQNENLLSELAEFKATLETVRDENATLNGRLSLAAQEKINLESDKDYFAREVEKLALLLADCKGSLDSSEAENINLKENITLVVDERNKIQEDNAKFNSENEKLSLDLADIRGVLESLQEDHNKTMNELKEANVHLHQLAEENIGLNRSIDEQKSETKHFSNSVLSSVGQPEKLVQGSDVSFGDQISGADEEQHHSDNFVNGSSLDRLMLNIDERSPAFVILKRHIDEAVGLVQRFDRTIEEMIHNSASMSRSVPKKVVPDVSRLIQAFESKANTDEHDAEETPLTENRLLADSYNLLREQTRSLKGILEEVNLDAAKASQLLNEEREKRIVAESAVKDLSISYNTLKDHSESSEAVSIELLVLYEILKQLISDAATKDSEVLTLFQTLRHQWMIHEVKNGKLGEKLMDYELRVNDLLMQLDEANSKSTAMESSFSNEVEVLHKELSDRVFSCEQEWNSTVAQVIEKVRKLEYAVVNTASPMLPMNNHDAINVVDFVSVSVDAASEVIASLQEKVETSNKDRDAILNLYQDLSQKFADLHDRNKLSISVLGNIYSTLGKYASGSIEIEQFAPEDQILEGPLFPVKCDTLVEHLETALRERQELESINKVLNSELKNTTKVIEELKERSLDSDMVRQMVEDVEDAFPVEYAETESTKLELRLRSLISWLLKKLEENKQGDLSERAFVSKELELTELHGQIDQLSSMIAEHENDNFIFKECLSQAWRDLIATRSKVLKKINELEQSEHRVSSIREKLSIAVSKGKGLIGQRDSLKQSLAEMSSELEKYSQELQLKDAKIRELETYSEAGERMEALESELSYIRHSATALRESFLLKDSILQRIEEILEDLELPEHFHSRDTIEKVDWIASLVQRNLLPPADGDTTSAVGGGSHSDVGLPVMDGLSEDAERASPSDDDLRRKFDELQSRFYSLAEHNEMLEESLKERNGDLQRWEEILDGINMPLQLRSMDPEDRFEWLRGALSESQHHCNSLQQKVGNFEILCQTLTSDLEESRKSISDLQFNFQSVTHEKDHLSHSLGTLKQDYDLAFEKVAQFELENGKLLEELNSLHEKLIEFEESKMSLSKLQLTIQDVIHEKEHLSDSFKTVKHDLDMASQKSLQHELENYKLQDELTALNEKLVKKVQTEDQIQYIEGKLKGLQDLVNDVLPDSDEDSVDDSSHVQHLERSLRKLLEKYSSASQNLTQTEDQIQYIEGKLKGLQDLVNDVLPDSDEDLVDDSSHVQHLERSLRKLLEKYSLASQNLTQTEDQIQYIEGKLKGLQDLVNDVLPDTDEDSVDDSSHVQHLERSLRKLLEKYSLASQNLTQTEDQIQYIEGKLKGLQDLVNDALPDTDEDSVDDSSHVQHLERSLRKLLEKYSLASQNLTQVDSHNEELTGTCNDRSILHGAEEDDVLSLSIKKELEEALHDLSILKEEKERCLADNQALILDIEALNRKKLELEELLRQEEQKSTTVREKLNLAVRKGKSLVQHRDSLKQGLDAANSELERLKSEVTYNQNAVIELEKKIKDLSSSREKLELVESENSFLRNQVAETDNLLQEKAHSLNLISYALNNIDADFNLDDSNLVQKLEQIGKRWNDLSAALASSQHDSQKSRRAAELLLAEVNEVQERNDGLQEELATAANEISELSAAKVEALSHLEKLSAVQAEDKNKQFSEMMVFKASLDQLGEEFSIIYDLLNDALTNDVEHLHNLKANILSCAESDYAFTDSSSFVASESGKKDYVVTKSMKDGNSFAEYYTYMGNQLQELKKLTGTLKGRLVNHIAAFDDGVKQSLEAADIVHKQLASYKESCESMKDSVARLQSIANEKDTTSTIMRKNISLLFEACRRSISEMENLKLHIMGNNGDSTPNSRVSLESTTYADSGNMLGGEIPWSNEGSVGTIADRLYQVVKDFSHMQVGIIEKSQKEMKVTITNLQKELQEKDIQRDRVCAELVSQIKDVDAAARSHLHNLKSAELEIIDLKERLRVTEEGRNLLERRVAVLQDGEATSRELVEKVGSLTSALAAKDQETETLMQALDEEEIQMEDLRVKIEDLEKVIQQKNMDIENLEVSGGKVKKKLSVTVSKFDELHRLSENLLLEIEKLQSQLQERDSEVSFLRQEVTRSTNESLVLSRTNSKVNSEIHDLLTWLDTTMAKVLVNGVNSYDDDAEKHDEQKELLKKHFALLVSEVEELRAAAHINDTLLHEERSKVEELTHRQESLESSLHTKESELTILQKGVDLGHATDTVSEIVEVEPLINKWTTQRPSTSSQVRSLRKPNNDQVAIAIDADQATNEIREDEDDDKAHGFKSLTTSRIIPRFTRPLTEVVDGLWMSCDRALMRQPTLRLGVIIYWALLHALLGALL
ncbi:trans-Golgi network-localized SYP41-interacting protein 1 isoform X2 [Impatiens glandulifera]|uniref:trans-Golgi network-localized SYP41-interacting protein 1 isoform X2 n=1 Tax=Impatiens glandulifera TaxID=253017 RepID=UPI001FB0FB19|nr:trans-Golgi network-localized SYP41-interacting protein 1 isoform X2 [Impatiens glandulifera]